MKSYTDLEQSKRLAELLPIESADMTYICIDICKGLKFMPEPIFIGNIPDHADEYDIPCWSLTALLSVMPQINEWITPYGHKDDKLFQFEPKICKMWEYSIMPSYKVIYGDKYGNGLSTDIYDNPVDACVAMIEKLHELNLL